MTEETPPDVWQQGPSDSNPWRQFVIQLKLVWRLQAYLDQDAQG